MSICQRSNGSWAVKYKDPTTGTWRQRQFRDRSSAAAFDAQAQLAAEKDEPLTLREAVMAYLESHAVCRIRARCVVRALRPDGIAGMIADRLVSSLNRRDLEAVRSRAAAMGIKNSTLNNYISGITASLKWCAEEDLIEGNPWAKYRIFRPAHYDHMTGTLEDLSKIYGFLPEWMRWAVRTCLALCLRPGPRELFSLEWSAFDWRSCTVSVYMPKVQRMKTVFIPAWYLPEARERFASRGSVKYVCPSDQGRRVTTIYSKAWLAAAKKAGVRMPFYAVRHIAASEMLAAGADLAAVAAQLGHRDITTTAAFYTHALARSQRAAAATLPTIPDMVGIGGAYSGNAPKVRGVAP